MLLERISSGVSYITRGSRLALADPMGEIGRMTAYLDKRRDRSAWRAIGRSPSDFYAADLDWASPLHAMLGIPAECQEADEFPAVWDDMCANIGVRGHGDQSHAALSLAFDANKYLLRALWCATRHTRPERVVETGVARGVTSRVVLEALARNGNGHLWSIDLPHPANDQLGVAVTAALQPRWTLLLGTSKALLPGLLEERGEIDLFVHDSLHTGRNVEFELRLAWQHLRSGGLLFADDVHQNLGFHEFVRAENVSSWFVGCRARKDLLWGVARKP